LPTLFQWINQFMAHFAVHSPVPRSSPSPKKCRRVFRPDEDSQLASLVAKFGVRNWDDVAKHMPDRTARQCRDRWKFYVCPSVNRAPWTVEEDRLLLSKHREIGGKWSVLCQFFQSRSLNNVKNRWNSVIRKVRAFNMDENSDRDFLYCAYLITQAVSPFGEPGPEGPPFQPNEDPLSVFQVERLLNHDVEGKFF
jgi:hypothetical protein